MGISWGRSEPGGEPPRFRPDRRDAGDHRRPSRKRDIGAELIAPLSLLTGLWVAVSPRFLPLQADGNNATAEVIIGLGVAGLVTLALISRRGLARRHLTALVLGVWVVLISAFMLDASVRTGAPLYWSNTWSGAMLTVLALTDLTNRSSAAAVTR